MTLGALQCRHTVHTSEWHLSRAVGQFQKIIAEQAMAAVPILEGVDNNDKASVRSLYLQLLLSLWLWVSQTLSCCLYLSLSLLLICLN